MLLLLLIGFFVFVTAQIFFPRSRKDYEFYLLGFMALTVFGLLFSALFSLVISDTITKNTPLVSLNDGEQSSGHYFLGSGIHKDRVVFFYYTKSKSGAVLDWKPTRQATIKETTGTPHMAVQCDDYTQENPWWAWPWNYGQDCDGHVTFFVPKGSVKSDYMLSAN